MTHLKHDHKSKPQGQQMPVETSEMTLTISKLRVPYKNKRSVLFTHAATHIFQVFTVIIGRAYNWKGIFKIDSAFTAFKRNTAFQTRYAKVVPFGNRRYTSCESGPFSVGSDGIWKVTGLDLRVENPRTPPSALPPCRIQLCWVPSGRYQSDEFSIKPTCTVYWWYSVEPRPMKSLGSHSRNCLATQQNGTAVWARTLTWRRWERPAERTQ